MEDINPRSPTEAALLKQCLESIVAQSTTPRARGLQGVLGVLEALDI